MQHDADMPQALQHKSHYVALEPTFFLRASGPEDSKVFGRIGFVVKSRLPFPLGAIEETLQSQRYFISGLLRVERWLRCTPSHCQQFEDIRRFYDTVFHL
jgi:hypothetical protein